MTLAEPFNHKEILIQQKCKAGPIANSLSCVSFRNAVACTDTNKHYHSSTVSYNKDGPELQGSGLNPKFTHVSVILDLEFCSATVLIQRVTDTVTET